jgi:predicted amidophosphoribosyltransferase
VEALRRVPTPNPDPRFEVVPGRRVIGRSVVLVDDVVTTGTTLATCAAALMAAGATAVSAIAVAWDELHLTARRRVFA